MRRCSNCSEMVRDKDWDSHACLPRTPAEGHDTPERIFIPTIHLRGSRSAGLICWDSEPTWQHGTEYVRADLARPAPSDHARALREARISALAEAENIAWETAADYERNGYGRAQSAAEHVAERIAEIPRAALAPTPEEPADAR